ncbi:MAG: 4'-phosphopantetheinyl transferase superfamily protein [Taibaiella sp.]|nr:4'-phosphopantetheinyl transferase superfamily protein [Taibaiella sp.]
MPILHEFKINHLGRAAIWKIEEPESFFAEATGITTAISNEKRRIEHLAGRYLLRFLDKDFPLADIAKDEHDKPRITDNDWFFSISHSWPYVAVALDPLGEAGIDIQTWHPRIASIKDKYLSDEEQHMLRRDEKHFLLAWCAKEAAYKWNGRRGVDFIEHLPIVSFDANKELMIYSQLKEIPQMIFMESLITDEFACSYVSKAQNWAIW